MSRDPVGGLKTCCCRVEKESDAVLGVVRVARVMRIQ
jgi:hypothetical protein